MANIDRNEAIKTIKAALKARSGKSWSVTGGRGTAWGWIKISVPPSRLGCARHHDFIGPDYNDCGDCGANRFVAGYAGCPAHTCTDKCYRGSITPEDAAELKALLGGVNVSSGVLIPSDSTYRNEYIARAAGLEPTVLGKPYWD